MSDDKKRRLSKSNSKLQRILDELGPDLAQYFDDIRKPRMIKKNAEKNTSSFSSGDEVLLNNNYGIVIYGPYQSEFGKETYEIEIDGGEIVTVEYDGTNIEKYSHQEQYDDEDDDFFN